jgi:hypothetical protein
MVGLDAVLGQLAMACRDAGEVPRA